MANESNLTATTATTETSTSGTTIKAGDTITASDPGKHSAKKQPDTPSVEELSLQLAKANADNARFKNSIDKLTHENAELTRWKKERMTAVEQQNEEEAKAKEQMQDRIKELESYMAINEASKRYLEMGMSVEMATETATAEVSGDMDVVMRNINKNKEDALTAAKAEWLKSRPDILAGGDGKSITQEQFEKMSLQKRTELKRNDPDTYYRLVGKAV